jgi:glycosyltransferase involved in cell wall biosynthesis
LGLGECVRLLGQLRDTRTFYQGMDLFVLNSIREGLPNVVLEAMALGVPVIATRIAGIPSLIRPGETGILIEPERSVELHESMRGCLGGAVDTKQLVQGARQLIEREYSFDRRMAKIASIYDAMFG